VTDNDPFASVTCEQIAEAVREFNRGLGARHALAVRAALVVAQTLPPSLGRFVAEVCVVADGLSIPFFQFEDRLAIETGWQLFQSAQSQHSDDWDAETTMLLGTVTDLENRTNLLPTPGAKRRQLSFLSKYLHFCINDAFPIFDSNAKKVLGGDWEPSWESYKKWLSLVRQEVTNHKECLEQVRLPGESLVRTLDKALYIIGSGPPGEKEDVNESV